MVSYELVLWTIVTPSLRSLMVLLGPWWCYFWTGTNHAILANHMGLLGI